MKAVLFVGYTTGGGLGLRTAILTCLSALIFAGVARAEIPWRSSSNQPSEPQNRAVAADEIDRMARESGERHFIVGFSQPVDDHLRQQMLAGGVRLLAYLGDDSFFAVADAASVNQEVLAAVPALRSALQIERPHKLHPFLLLDQFPVYTVVGQTTGSETAPPVDIVAVYIMFHRDVNLGNGLAAVAAHDGFIRDELRSINGAVVEIPQDQIKPLADRDEIQWIEPALPQFSEMNDSNRVVTEANTAQSVYGLDGTGVNVLVYDGGYGLASHADFGGRLTVRDSSGLADHATHVSGTIGGSGANSGGQFRGMAPNVTIQSYGFEWSGGGTFLYSNPGDIEADYSQAINTYNVDIANNSIGTNTATNGFDCAITGNYGITSNLIDTIVRGDSSNPLFTEPFRIVWANGNERQTTRCGNLYNTTAPPATAKNHITVGALNSNDDSMTSFSSWGPTDDGRMKPDISAPGCQSGGDGGVTSTSSSGGYSVKCGTSMASPTVCGLSALLIQDFRAQFAGQPLLRNSTLKALLAHTAQDRGNTGPDYQFGYGSVRIKQAIDEMRLGKFKEGQVSHGSTFTTQFLVQSTLAPFRVTLAWDDAPGTPNVNPALVNDLDLRVFDPSANQHFPWTLNPNPGSQGNPATQNQADHINNIEQVLVNNPAIGIWTIEVVGFNVPEGPQPFSLVGDGAQNVGTNITLPSGLPGLTPPDVATTIDVSIVSIGETTVPGSPTLHYRYDGGAFQTAPLAPTGGNNYQATLPPAACGDQPEFYFSAEGSQSGVVTSPPGAPAMVYGFPIGESTIFFEDNFQTDKGWTTENLGASSGFWQRGVPVNDPGWAYDPPSDSDGSGQCFLTQNQFGNTDVDGGAVRLTSPVFDLTAGNGTIQYDYFLRLTDTSGGVDALLVEINNGNAVWIQIARHTSDGGLSWRTHVVTQADLDAAGVTVTSTMRLRFTANDADPQSINEAGLDAVLISGVSCDSGVVCIPGDVNDDGDVNAKDILRFVDVLTAGGGTPVETCAGDLENTPDGVIDFDDLENFVTCLIAGGC